MSIQQLFFRFFTVLLYAQVLINPAIADEFLDPAQAFKLTVTKDTQGFVAQWEIASGYHLYADRISASSDEKGVTVGSLDKPQGIEKFDANFDKNMTIYKKSVSIRVPVSSSNPSDAPLAIKLSSQGCAEAGLCYPPQEEIITLTGLSSTTPQSAATPVQDNGSDANIASTLASGSVWRVAAMFLGLGVLLSFTPCVLPMIPILSSIIVGASGSSKGKGFALSVAYSAGMILVYTLLGLAAGLIGEGLAAALQKPWVITVFASALFLFGLAMFDVFTLQMPAGIQDKLNNASNKVPGGKFVGVFVMGGLSAMIVGPCVAAPLAGALVYISKTGNVMTGGIALFFLALGMSVPLLLTGLSAGKLLPRAGNWMEGIKRFFGLLLFATALWLANSLLPQIVFMLACALLLLMAASWLHAFSPLPASSGLAATTGKAVGLVFAGMAALQVIGVASGGRDVMQPLKHLAEVRSGSGIQTANTPALKFANVTNGEQLNSLLKTSNKPVVLDFYADWCTSCKEMEHSTLADPKVVELLSNATLVRADVTANSSSDKALMKRFGLFGPPALLVLKPTGEEIPAARVIGYKASEPFIAQLKPALLGKLEK
jgi:thioredoxin:protein disulfide reductase